MYRTGHKLKRGRLNILLVKFNKKHNKILLHPAVAVLLYRFYLRIWLYFFSCFISVSLNLFLSPYLRLFVSFQACLKFPITPLPSPFSYLILKGGEEGILLTKNPSFLFLPSSLPLDILPQLMVFHIILISQQGTLYTPCLFLSLALFLYFSLCHSSLASLSHFVIFIILYLSLSLCLSLSVSLCLSLTLCLSLSLASLQLVKICKSYSYSLVYKKDLLAAIHIYAE